MNMLKPYFNPILFAQDIWMYVSRWRALKKDYNKETLDRMTMFKRNGKFKIVCS